jgi:hypothetical protein
MRIVRRARTGGEECMRFVRNGDSLLQDLKQCPQWGTAKGTDQQRFAQLANIDSGHASRILHSETLVSDLVYGRLFNILGVKLHQHLTDRRREPKSDVTAMAFSTGSKAFEALMDQVNAGPSKAQLVLFSCTTSHFLAGKLLEQGISVEILISDPLYWHQQGNHDKVHQTLTVFSKRSDLKLKVKGTKAGLTVYVYEKEIPPFRGFYVEGVGVAIGPYERVSDAGQQVMKGNELPAVLITSADPAFEAWRRYFEEQFARLRGTPPRAKMSIGHENITVEPEVLKLIHGHGGGAGLPSNATPPEHYF